MSDLQIPMSVETQRYYDRQRRKAIRKMAIACDIDPAQYPSVKELWTAVTEKMAGGQLESPHRAVPPIGDGFAIFVRAICTNHRQPYEMTLVHKCRNGHAYDEFEAKKVIEYLQNEMPACDECGEKITTWHTEQNRLSIYGAEQKVRIARGN